MDCKSFYFQHFLTKTMYALSYGSVVFLYFQHYLTGTVLIWKWTRAFLNLILSQGKFQAQRLSFSITRFFLREEFVQLFANVVEHCRFEFFHLQLHIICFESISFRRWFNLYGLNLQDRIQIRYRIETQGGGRTVVRSPPVCFQRNLSQR